MNSVVKKKFIILPSSIVGALLVAWLDYSTHARMSFYLFFFPSIMATAWFGTNRGTWLMVFLCSTAWFFTNPYWPSFLNDPILIWNLFVRILTFTFVAWATDFIQNKQENLVDLNKKVSEMLRFEKELSRKDHLTGALNSRALEERMAEERAKARRYGRVTSLLYIDLDHFKSVNDNHGHQYGDLMLKEVVSIIKKNIRDVDFVARLGGDEFAVLLPETDEKNAKNCASRILESLNKDIPPPLTASIGMVLFSDLNLSNPEIIKMADDAMYRAKKAGRNTVMTTYFSADLSNSQPCP